MEHSLCVEGDAFFRPLIHLQTLQTGTGRGRGLSGVCAYIPLKLELAVKRYRVTVDWDCSVVIHEPRL